MNLESIFDAIVPDNIKNIEVVRKCSDIFIEQLNRNSIIAKRITDLFEIDKRTWLQQGRDGEVKVITDSDFVVKSKNVLKQGLFQVYLCVLYNLVEKTQTDPGVKVAVEANGYSDSAIQKNLYDVLTKEYLGAFRFFQQNSGTLKAISYIYQFARYLETGMIVSDLELDDTTGTFTLRYNGPLNFRFFRSFNQPMAHPAGWCYEYESSIKILLEDYFGIKVKYTMPKGVSLKTTSGKYLVFTTKTQEKFIESLSEPYNVVSDSPLSQEEIEDLLEGGIKTFTGTFENALGLLKQNNAVLYNKKFKKFFKESTFRVVEFTDGSCLLYDRNLYFGSIRDIYETQKMIKIPGDFILNLGPDELLESTKKIEIIYKDELEFESSMDIAFDETAGYYKNSFENQFHVVGSPYPYVPGVDESKNRVLNYETCKGNLECFRVTIPAKSPSLTYLSMKDSFNHGAVKTEVKPTGLSTLTHGWYGNELTFRALTGKAFDYDFYLKTNIVNNPMLIKVSTFKIGPDTLTVKGTTRFIGTFSLTVPGYAVQTGTFGSGLFEFVVDTSLYPPHSDYVLEITARSETIHIESNGMNHIDNFTFGFPYYTGTPSAVLLTPTNADNIIGINEGGKSLSKLTGCSKTIKYSSSRKYSGYERDGNFYYPKGYLDLNSENYDGLTYIEEGFEFIPTDSVDCLITDSTEYVDDEFECFIIGSGAFLTFENDYEDGSTGKFLVTRYNKESDNLEGTRSILRGCVLTTSS
jgi:hypothetical protein